MAPKPTIAVIGSINMDLVTYTPRVPIGGDPSFSITEIEGT